MALAINGFCCLYKEVSL